MTNSTRSLICFFALALVSPACNAGGTVDFAHVDRLLQQRPEIRSLLLQTLTMPDGAYAQVRLGPHFKSLGGARLGPYTFDASPKDGRGPSVQVTLCTTALLLDDAGNTLSMDQDRYFSATQIRELLNAVVLRAAGTSGAASCP
jgi:hypothetical protein